MIESFRDRRTAAVFLGRMPKGFPPDIAAVARRKLRMLDAAIRLEDLRAPPGNRLETLGRDRTGQHSIRINDQWRVCFVWSGGAAHEVEIVDCHQASGLRQVGTRRAGEVSARRQDGTDGRDGAA